MGIVNFFKGIVEAASHRRATNLSEKIIDGIEKISNKLPKFKGGDELLDPLKKASAEVESKFAQYKNAVRDGVDVGAAKEALTDSRKAAAVLLKNAKKHVGDIKSLALGNSVGRVVSSKFFIVPAFIASATYIISKVFSGKEKQRRAELVENRKQNIAAQQAEVSEFKANTMMGLAPAPGDHAARVMAGRSGASMGINTSNPEMTAANFTVV